MEETPFDVNLWHQQHGANPEGEKNEHGERRLVRPYWDHSMTGVRKTFIDLPTEIRNMIYTLNFQHYFGCDIQHRHSIDILPTKLMLLLDRGDPSALADKSEMAKYFNMSRLLSKSGDFLLVSKQIRREALALYFSLYIFKSNNPWALATWLQYIGPEHRSNLNSVVFVATAHKRPKELQEQVEMFLGNLAQHEDIFTLEELDVFKMKKEKIAKIFQMPGVVLPPGVLKFQSQRFYKKWDGPVDDKGIWGGMLAFDEKDGIWWEDVTEDM